MIEINKDEVIEVTILKPFKESKEELLETIYALLPLIHKEPLCNNYELFVQPNGTILSLGRWQSERGYNFHKNMQYREDLINKELPRLCQTHKRSEFRGVIPPLTALSLLNEK